MNWDLLMGPLPLLAILTGLCMGLMGSGGSLLTVPIFMHIFNLNSKLAVMASLAVVGINAVFGSILNIKDKHIDWTAALSFIPGSMLGTYLGARMGLVMSQTMQVNIFVAIVFFAAYKMFRANSAATVKLQGPHKIATSFFYSMIIGLLTGVLGVGGGFLIVPALVLLVGLEHKHAVGTSLFIICFNAFLGFWVYQKSLNLQNYQQLIVYFSVIAMLGVFIGHATMKKLPLKTFRLIFAFALVFLGAWMLIKNF